MTRETEDGIVPLPPEGGAPGTCAEIRRVLQLSWDGCEAPSTRGAAPSPVDEKASIEHHLRDCPECRRAAEEVRRVDRALRIGFERLTASFSPPTRECLDTVIRRVREEGPEGRLRRRLGRALRTGLWGAFWAITLAAFSLLALAAYKALR